MQLQEGTQFLTQEIIIAYHIVFSVSVFFTEFSPYIFENFIVDVLPFLKLRYGKPALYLFIGSFCYDPESVELMRICGITIQLNAALWALYYYQRSLVSPSDYRGFSYPSTDLASILHKNKQSNDHHLKTEQVKVQSLNTTVDNEMEFSYLTKSNENRYTMRE
ncbi:UNKNOWN [Stylonychia lemnae]|uniref:Uncharacterized protein n=1 Tax=Stylonychia lemnae TaxID=5949 RepID=A0A078BCT3_STYLE|nr:UNKNOWN [Stylonychia lemnae]|eukprot:CDW91393.1 UNKNOWN [Stylonychia lemnae]